MTTTPEFARVDAQLLVLENNVRKDLSLTKEFQASITQHGVLEPIVAYPDPINDGCYRVHIGHRRAAAAHQAGLTDVPVYLITEREAIDRITEQVSENIHRTALTPADEAAAYKEFALFGLPASQIAKRTSTRLARVGDGLKLADTTWKHQPAPQLTFDQLAALAEFADDATQVRKLEQIALDSPTQLPHSIATARKERETRDLKKALNTQIADAGWEKIALDGYGYIKEAGTAVLTDLALESTPHEKIRLEQAEELPNVILGAAVVEEWENVDGEYTRIPKIQHYVRDWKESGLIKWRPERDVDPDDAAREAEREQHEAVRAARLEARATAKTVRHEFITQLLQRSRIPDIDTFIAAGLITCASYIGTDVGEYAADWLGLTVPNFTHDDDGPTELERLLLRHLNLDNSSASRATTLALIIEAHEHNLDRSEWAYQFDQETATTYLLVLEGWGYGLSDYEKNLTRLDGDQEPAATA